ncbi:MAG: hypothetical protein GKR90_22285 [Pseudomonadales bacterium]|nr:hypothetical protein [Pseudomonadales bacterium]
MSITNLSQAISRQTTLFRSLHALIGLIGVSATIVLALSEGHPPGIVLVPIALVFWALGHTFLWVSYKLSVRTDENLAGLEHKWPVSLTLLAIFFGAISFIGLILIILTLLDGYNRASELPPLLAIWLPATVCFVGITLRKNWSRFSVSGAFVAVALLLVTEMVQSLVQNSNHSVAEWLISISISLLSFFIAWYTFASPRIKAFHN